jgi:hypothetical protein
MTLFQSIFTSNLCCFAWKRVLPAFCKDECIQFYNKNLSNNASWFLETIIRTISNKLNIFVKTSVTSDLSDNYDVRCFLNGFSDKTKNLNKNNRYNRLLSLFNTMQFVEASPDFRSLFPRRARTLFTSM